MSAVPTRWAVKVAVVSYWIMRYPNGEYVDLGNGRYRGKPGKNADLSVLIKSLVRR